MRNGPHESAVGIGIWKLVGAILAPIAVFLILLWLVGQH